MITPESARLQSNENAWKRLSPYCKKGMQSAIDKGLTQVRINYNNRYYEYFWHDIKILRSIGYSIEILDETFNESFYSIHKDARIWLIINW